MHDPTSAYRTAQVETANPVGQVVLLYEGAIRFATLHLRSLERQDIVAAHNSSLRAQAIVSALQETLDISIGPIAAQLDALYDFALRRLVAGNLSKQAGPTEEAITVLRELLDAWREIARQQGGAPAGSTPVSSAPSGTPSLAGSAASAASAAPATLGAPAAPPAPALAASPAPPSAPAPAPALVAPSPAILPAAPAAAGSAIGSIVAAYGTAAALPMPPMFAPAPDRFPVDVPLRGVA